MDCPPKLSGETLIVHHIPLVHCQVAAGGCRQVGGGGGSFRRSNPFSPPENLGLSRTTSLPERDILQQEPLVYSSLIQTSSSSLSPGHTRPPGTGSREGEGEETRRRDGAGQESQGNGGKRREEKGRGREGEDRSGNVTCDVSLTSSQDGSDYFHSKGRSRRLRHNPFLLNHEEDEEEDEDEEDEEDNLNGYMEDSSFHLHGSSSGEANDDEDDVLTKDGGLPSFHLHELGFHQQVEPFLLHGHQPRPWHSSSSTSSCSGGSRRQTRAGGGCCRAGSLELAAAGSGLEGLGLFGLTGGQRRHGSSGSTLSMDCGEQDWGEEEDEEEEELEEDEDEDHPMRSVRGSQGGSSSGSSSAQRCSCCGLSQPYPEPFGESFPDCHQGYASDSSCNSSDGVLVNFSTIYNKMNNTVPSITATSSRNVTKAHQNLNSSTDLRSCTSLACDSPARGDGMAGESAHGSGAFYLDLHTSPSKPPDGAHAGITLPASDVAKVPATTSSQPNGTMDLDANCNSYHHLLHHSQVGGEEALGMDEDSTVADVSTPRQSQARLVVATQNYYKLVTCDLSSQSSPSPVGSTATSCSDEQSKGSPPGQPSEYYLFQQHKEEEEAEQEEEQEEEEDELQLNDFRLTLGEPQCQGKSASKLGTSASDQNIIEGQVYVNISPTVGHLAGGAAATAVGHTRSRSYDRNLDKSPLARLGSLERMLSCPVRLGEGGVTLSPSPPPRVTSFAEIARNKRRTVGAGAGAMGGSSCLRTGPEAYSYSYSSTTTTAHSTHSQSSAEFSPILEDFQQGESHSLPPLTRCYSQGSWDSSPPGHRSSSLRGSPGVPGNEVRTKAEGSLSSSADSTPAVVRYSKEQRPTTLPIQPFTFQHQFHKSHKPLLPLLSEYVTHMQARGAASAAASSSAPEAPNDGENEAAEGRQAQPTQWTEAEAQVPSAVRPSPLGSYSPVRLQARGSSSAASSCSTCSPSPSYGLSGGSAGASATVGQCKPPRSLSCPIAAGLLPTSLSHSPPGTATADTRSNMDAHGKVSCPSPSSSPSPPSASALKRSPEPAISLPTRPGVCVHRASRPPLLTLPTMSTTGMDAMASLEQHSHECMKNVIPSYGVARPANVHSMKQFQQCYSDFLPDYFSQTEQPPEEFCLSPDAPSDDSSISIDLTQKRGLVKAVNTAVDLIVAHFGSSRDPGVKAKLGNSSVSPNIGHLILKYLCPAIREILQDGLRSYVLDLIIGQRRNQPWSVVEASTQLGPATRALHNLFTKVTQYSELTSHSMRLNAFIFGLLNLRCLEFWFTHMNTHEDVVATHFHPWGFLSLTQGVCQSLFEELLLLLQPLSLLPFDLDLLFEPHLLQKGQEHLRRKEQLCSVGQALDQSTRSTFQLMRGRAVSQEGPITEEGMVSGVGHMKNSDMTLNQQTAPCLRARGGASRRCLSEPRHLGAGSEDPDVAVKAQRPMANDDMGLWRQARATSCSVRGKGVGGDWAETEHSFSMSQGPGGLPEAGRLRSRQAGWWYQLMQSSQVYIDNSTEGSKFVKWEKRKKPGSERRRQSQPPPREGVVEGAESAQHGLEEGREPGSRRSTRTASSSSISSSGSSSGQSTCGASTGSTRLTRTRASWMGSPPESVLSELKKCQVKEAQEAPASSQPAALDEGPALGMRWSRLFGASTLPRTEKTEKKATRCPKSRPSGWLSLDRSMLGWMGGTVGPSRPPDGPAESTSASLSHGRPQQTYPLSAEQKAPCEVRALCHHVASEPGQLSFQKGDVLHVLGRADPDWLLCSLGNERGLVPIIYVTLRGEEEEGAVGH